MNMKIILNFSTLALLFIFNNGEIVKSDDYVGESQENATTRGIIQFNSTKSSNIRVGSTEFVGTNSDDGAFLSTLTSQSDKFNNTTYTASKSFFSSVDPSSLTSTTLSVGLENTSTTFSNTKLPLVNMSESRSSTQSSGNSNLVEAFSGKETSFLQLSNGKQVNIAKKVNRIVYSSGNDRSLKIKIDESSDDISNGKLRVVSNLEDSFRKELNAFIKTINCYRDISLSGQSSTRSSCPHDIDTSKNSIVKEIKLTKQENVKLYSGINSLRFTFIDRGNSSEIAYEILKV